MKIKILFLTFFGSLSFIVAQSLSSYYSDAFLQQPPSVQSSVKISSVNLTGNYHELVIAIGFPDRNPYYPRFWANSAYPLLGIFRNGTLLKDYVDQQGGSIPIDEWYKPAFDTYFNTHSNGLYNVDFKFVKKPNGNPYTTTNTFNYFRTLNGSGTNVIINNLYSIVTEAVRNIYADSSNMFTGISAIHCIFNVQGDSTTTKNEFWSAHGGTIDNSVTIRNSLNQIIYSGPVSYQWNPDPVIHERMHIIGEISGIPSGFKGFPDRGYDVQQYSHGNLTGNYDVMYHNGNVLPDQYSLYGLPPINTHDLMFLGWIKDDEILTIRNQNLNGVKLADVNYSLTSQQKSNGFYRVAKVMLNENYDGDWDEYLLVEFHNATEFDKNFTNYDEPLNDKYNKGILVWHIKETKNLLGQWDDNMIDVVPAVPYNGYYSNPTPNDSYPGHNSYSRTNYNGIPSGENDYLDDLRENEVAPNVYNFINLPDGGRHVWETTTTSYRPYGWYEYPSGTQWFFRSMSMKSDFFTDAQVKGRINNSMTALTRPSTKDWEGNQTYISITNIRRIDNNQNMAFDIRFNDVPTFQISGRVTNSGGQGLSGVLITFSNNGGTTTSNQNGDYSISLNQGWSGTATPTLNCNTFNPASRTYSSLSTNYVNQDFTGSAGTVTISGTIRDNSNNPIEGVTVTFSNNGGTVTTNATGIFSNQVACGWSGTITPSKTNYTFTPTDISFVSVLTDQSNQNFTVISPSEYTISGTITDNFGNPLSNVLVVFSGSSTVTSSSSGNYIKVLAPGWSGTIDARMSGWMFSPLRYTISNLNSSLTKNFVGIQEMIVSGYVKNAEGQPIPNVEMYFRNLVTGHNDFSSGTSPEGYYNFELVPYGYSGMIVPELTGYTFVPPAVEYNNITSEIRRDFRADIIKYNLRGRITDNSGIPINNVTVVFSGGINSAITNANGDYTALIPYNWSGTATPQKIGHSFSPQNRTYAQVTQDYYTQNFIDLGTHLEIPQNLTAVDLVQNGKVRLTWNPINNVGNYFSRYYIFEDLIQNPTRLIDSVSNVNQTTKEISGLTNYVTHYFRVAVKDLDGIRGGYSDNASALPTKDTIFSITLTPRNNSNPPYISLPVIPLDGIYTAPQVFGGVRVQAIMSNTQIWRWVYPYYSSFELQIGQGYYILPFLGPPYINFVGRPLNGGVSISIPYTGNNQIYYIGYPYATSHHYASQLFNGTGVNYAEDGYGNFYIQGYIDMLMKPGRGYSVQTYYDVTLNYPLIPYWQNVIGQQFFYSSNSSLPEEQYKGKLKFKRNGKPYAIIISKIDDDNKLLSDDVEIGAYDGEDCVGGVIYDGKLPMLLVAWLEQKELGTKENKKGNIITLKTNSISGKKDFTITSKFTKGGAYGSDVYTLVELTLANKKNQTASITDEGIVQNYPNPFNPSTVISFTIKERDFVTLKVFDLLGREIKSLVNEERDAGVHNVTFDATYLASGVYFYTLITRSFNQTRKMFLIK